MLTNEQLGCTSILYSETSPPTPLSKIFPNTENPDKLFLVLIDSAKQKTRIYHKLGYDFFLLRAAHYAVYKVLYSLIKNDTHV